MKTKIFLIFCIIVTFIYFSYLCLCNVCNSDKEKYVSNSPHIYGPTTKNIFYDDNGKLGSFPLVPPGLIVMWSGTSVPQGWALCDGTQETPDLRGRFVMGASDTPNLGETGGLKKITLTDDQLPRHKHIATSTFDISKLSLTSGGSHKHTFNKKKRNPTDADTGVQIGNASGSNSSDGKGNSDEAITFSNETHTHDLVYKGTYNANNIVTTVLTNTAEMGTTKDPVPNIPPYFVLAYIMKL